MKSIVSSNKLEQALYSRRRGRRRMRKVSHYTLSSPQAYAGGGTPGPLPYTLVPLAATTQCELIRLQLRKAQRN